MADTVAWLFGLAFTFAISTIITVGMWNFGIAQHVTWAKPVVDLPGAIMLTVAFIALKGIARK